MVTEHSKAELYYLLAMAILAAYGSYGVFVRWTGLAGNEALLLFWRLLISLPLLVGLSVIAGRAQQLVIREHRLMVLLAGLVFAVQSYSSIKAIYLLPVSDAVFIIYLAPVLVAILAPLLLKEKLERVTIVALPVAVGGLALISFTRTGGDKHLNAAGIGYAALSAVTYAFLVIILKALRESMPTITLCVYQTAVAMVVILPFSGFRVPHISANGWAALLVIGAFHGGLLGWLYVYVVKKVKAQFLGVVAYIEPVSASVYALVLLGEKPGWQSYVGGALIIAAGLLVLFKGTSAPREAL